MNMLKTWLSAAIIWLWLATVSSGRSLMWVRTADAPDTSPSRMIIWQSILTDPLPELPPQFHLLESRRGEDVLTNTERRAATFGIPSALNLLDTGDDVTVEANIGELGFRTDIRDSHYLTLRLQIQNITMQALETIFEGQMRPGNALSLRNNLVGQIRSEIQSSMYFGQIYISHQQGNADYVLTWALGVWEKGFGPVPNADDGKPLPSLPPDTDSGDQAIAAGSDAPHNDANSRTVDDGQKKGPVKLPDLGDPATICQRWGCGLFSAMGGGILAS